MGPDPDAATGTTGVVSGSSSLPWFERGAHEFFRAKRDADGTGTRPR